MFILPLGHAGLTTYWIRFPKTSIWDILHIGWVTGRKLRIKSIQRKTLGKPHESKTKSFSIFFKDILPFWTAGQPPSHIAWWTWAHCLDMRLRVLASNRLNWSLCLWRTGERRSWQKSPAFFFVSMGCSHDAHFSSLLCSGPLSYSVLHSDSELSLGSALDKWHVLGSMPRPQEALCVSTWSLVPLPLPW